jgi:hypothetical protein
MGKKAEIHRLWPACLSTLPATDLSSIKTMASLFLHLM